MHVVALYRSFLLSTPLLLTFCSNASIALSLSGKVGCEWWYIEKSLSLCGEDRLSTCSLISAFARSSFLSSLTANSSVCQPPALGQVFQLTGLILVSTSHGIDAKRHGRVNWAKHQLEQHETDQDGLRIAGKRGRSESRVKAKGRVERAVVDEDGEHDEGEEELRLGDGEEFGRVGVVPVAELVPCESE